jgi:hypothetical protein
MLALLDICRCSGLSEENLLLISMRYDSLHCAKGFAKLPAQHDFDTKKIKPLF